MNPYRLLTCSLLAALAAAAAPAQRATVQDDGANQCAMPLSILGLPRLGSTLGVFSQGSVYFNRRLIPTFVMFGLSDARIGTTPLPFPVANLFPLSSVSASCGDLLQSADFVALMPATSNLLGTTTYTVTIPVDPRLLGLVVHCQTMLVSHCMGYCAPGGGTYGLASQGARITVGV